MRSISLVEQNEIVKNATVYHEKKDILPPFISFLRNIVILAPVIEKIYSVHVLIVIVYS